MKRVKKYILTLGIIVTIMGLIFIVVGPRSYEVQYSKEVPYEEVQTLTQTIQLKDFQSFDELNQFLDNIPENKKSEDFNWVYLMKEYANLIGYRMATVDATMITNYKGVLIEVWAPFTAVYVAGKLYWIHPPYLLTSKDKRFFPAPEIGDIFNFGGTGPYLLKKATYDWKEIKAKTEVRYITLTRTSTITKTKVEYDYTTVNFGYLIMIGGIIFTIIGFLTQRYRQKACFMKKCRYCGKELPLDAEYCSECGKKVR